MRISVEYDRCEGHGMCCLSAPDVFSLDDDGLLQYAYEGVEVPDSARPAAEFAVTACPVAALHQG